MSDRLKYHAEIDFRHKHGDQPEKVRFTAVDLERLLARFSKECTERQKRNTEARHYVWLEPKLTTEVCLSWSEFDQFEH